MSNQHRYEQRRSAKHRAFTVGTLLATICALCSSVVLAFIVIHQNAVNVQQIKTTVTADRIRSDQRWCTLLNQILTAPRQPGQPAKPTPSQIRFAKTLIKLADEFGCVRK